MSEKKIYEVLIIGAGPAGLTAGYLLSKQNRSSIIIEASDMVGGISRTPQYKNFYFDIGGHRFFSQSDTVEKLWDEMLPNQLLTRPRQSRIFYKKQFYHYPLKALNVLLQLGFFESVRCVLSYGKARLKPLPPTDFSNWVINHFGKRLYHHFFKTYTEKVWGIPCENISADWAAQRIKGLSLLSAIKDALTPRFLKREKKAKIKTLTTHFRYPPKGPGQLWESCAKQYQDQGGVLIKNTRVEQCVFDQENNLWTISLHQSDGTSNTLHCRHLISSAPLRELVCHYLSPKPSTECINAAKQLRYRDFLIVVLILKEKNHFTDNWIYIHDADVQVGRIQNFKSWSPEMVPDPTLCSYGLEYFCNENDLLWEMHDSDLITLATKELIQIGLANSEDILDGCVVRQPKAYPVYDQDYRTHIEVIKNTLPKTYPNLHLVGRNGLHKYNNQDHSMITAMHTVQNILSGKSNQNVWSINQDDAYHEEKVETAFDIRTGLRDAPI